MLQGILPRGPGLFSLAQPGGVGFMPALLSAAAMAAFGFALWRVRFFGGGDAKLMAAMAAFAGPAGSVQLVLITFISGGALALAAVLRPSARNASQPAATASRMAARLPYSLAIAAGAIGQATLASAGVQPW
jgi:prepilin peptidase CpaA